MGNRSVYKSSDGRYVGDADLWERFESGEWTPCCWDTESGEEWVETRDGGLLVLRPISPRAVPDWVDIEYDVDGVRTTRDRTATAD